MFISSLKELRKELYEPRRKENYLEGVQEGALNVERKIAVMLAATFSAFLKILFFIRRIDSGEYSENGKVAVDQIIIEPRMVL